LGVLAHGFGGLEEFREHFDEAERLYGLLRMVDIYDGHTTIKFVFVTWAGTKVSFMRKARMTTHKGSIVNLIGVCFSLSFLSFIKPFSDRVFLYLLINSKLILLLTLQKRMIFLIKKCYKEFLMLLVLEIEFYLVLVVKVDNTLRAFLLQRNPILLHQFQHQLLHQFTKNQCAKLK
jgi:hypothetical protein